MTQSYLLAISIVLALLLCAGCGAASAPPPVAPSPTIAASVRSPTPAGSLEARPSPSPANSVAQPTSAPVEQPTSALAQPPTAGPATGQAPAVEPSIYLWPAELPPDLKVSPKESRVAGEGELSPNGLGFYIVTLNAGDKKLVIGGGDLETLPLQGEERRVTVGQRTGKLITNDLQRELVLDVSRGKLFLYTQGFGEDELLRAAASLQPIDVRALRELAAH
jgi:hypothetical protein